MKAPSNYDKTEPQSGFPEYPMAGGYILRCLSIEETTSKEKADGSGGNPMIVFDFDISQGKFKGFYTRKFAENTKESKKWPLRYYQLVTDDHVGRYKGVIESFKKSNKNFPSKDFEGEEHNLKGLIGLEIGGVMQEEEYFKKDGSVGAILKIFYLTSIETAISSDVNIPRKKTVKTTEQHNGDLPF